MVGLRFTEEEFEPFKKAIEALGLTKSEFFRLLCINQLDPNIHSKVNSDKHDRILFLVNKTSNNINQIAKQINIAFKENTITEKQLIDWYRKLSIITDNLMMGIERVK